MADVTTAPWDEATVHALNACQHGGGFHGFTCAEHASTLLVANTDGWHCPERGCGYWQDWALLAMVDVGREVIAKSEARRLIAEMQRAVEDARDQFSRLPPDMQRDLTNGVLSADRGDEWEAL